MGDRAAAKVIRQEGWSGRVRSNECGFAGIPFLVVTSWHKEWIFGVAMCKIYMTTTSINQFTSSIFLTVMSADRYVAVCHPISSPKFRTNVIARSVM